MVLICISLIKSDIEHFFIQLLAVYIPSFEKCIRVLCPLFDGKIWGFLVICLSSLQIRDTSPLSDPQFVNIFSHSVGCSFTLLIIYFAVHKLFCLVRSHLFIYIFVAFVFGGRAMNSLPKPMSRRAFLMLLSRIFMVSGLRFKPWIHPELIFL